MTVGGFHRSCEEEPIQEAVTEFNLTVRMDGDDNSEKDQEAGGGGGGSVGGRGRRDRCKNSFFFFGNLLVLCFRCCSYGGTRLDVISQRAPGEFALVPHD